MHTIYQRGRHDLQPRIRSEAMNFIDIASWQHGINLPAVFASNPLDGVIIKATQGTGYVNPDYAGWARWLSDNNKPFGIYHYLDLYGAEAEARHFVDAVKPYIGKATLTADYEGNTIRKGAVYLKAFLDEVYRLTGVKPFVYVSQSYIATGGFGEIANAGYPLWIAQYADKAIVNGFLDKPWQKGSASPFLKYWMHQYTDNGRLIGYSGELDFDKFYGTVEDWNALAGGGATPTPTPTPTPVPALKPANPSIVLAVLKNEYGIGQERISRLRADGYDPTDVQNTINRLYGEAINVKKDIGNDISYLNSLLWIVRSL